ncbi:MAG: hypothetical protein ABSB30_12665 [Terracidiphilus sp.]
MAIRRVTWKQAQRALISQIKRTHVLLDIGPGIQPKRYMLPAVHICVEPCREYVSYLLKQTVTTGDDRNYVVLNCGWREALPLFLPGSVDSIFLIDVVEHLEKQEGAELLRRTIPLARRQVVIVTPYGFMPQHHEDGRDLWGFHGGSWQEHRSGWDERDFDETWDIYVVPEFYTRDNQGKPLDQPCGYMLAILNLDGPRVRIRGLRMRLIDLMSGSYHRMVSAYRWMREEVRALKRTETAS